MSHDHVLLIKFQNALERDFIDYFLLIWISLFSTCFPKHYSIIHKELSTIIIFIYLYHILLYIILVGIIIHESIGYSCGCISYVFCFYFPIIQLLYFTNESTRLNLLYVTLLFIQLQTSIAVDQQVCMAPVSSPNVDSTFLYGCK